MTPALRHRAVPESPVARWDARWKLAALLVAAGGAAAVDRPASAAAFLLAGLAVVCAARLPRRWVTDRLALLAVPAVPFLLVLPFTLDPTGPGTDVGPVRLSDRGLRTAAGVLFRGLAVGTFALALVGTAPLHHTFAAARKLGAPGLLVQLTLLAYRYAFLLADELRRLRVAARVRGFRPATTAHGYRTLGHMTGALLVRGADRADRVAWAMRCRGFDGHFHTLAAFRTRPADVALFLLAAVGTIAVVAWDKLR